ncbi:MAG: septum formation inhibitor Maf [Actinobacteria bacterium]|nr:septum formation inhibitor Maf [Actinomycetota bacterium]
MSRPGPAVVLASGSPRRRELLARLGIGFEVRVADLDETPLLGEAPRDYVARLAAAKAEAVAAAAPEADVVVLGADTTVVADGQILGKPLDDDAAARILRLLSGRTHEVLTGVAVVRRAGGGVDPAGVALAPARSVAVEVAATAVTFAELSDADVAWYVATGEPADKAGAYAVQGRGAVFVTSISGSPDNVIGLPLALARRLLEDAGVEALGSVSPPS